jgi:multidrug efflux pump subunit AcrA (membrane-fusion protein)
VPEAAIQASEQGFVTYVVEKGRAQLRPIQLGLRTGTGVVEILSGLKVGEIVVTEGSDRLAAGVPVEVVDSAAVKEPAGTSSPAAK